MSLNDPSLRDLKPTVSDLDDPTAAVSNGNAPEAGPARTSAGRRLRIAGLILVVLVVLDATGFFLIQHHIGAEMRDNLPQLDGSLTVLGLRAPVTVQRDAHGVPHIHA